jgi:ABC-type polysaccharide/polyol phosphate transport system ATPase subunit
MSDKNYAIKLSNASKSYKVYDRNVLDRLIDTFFSSKKKKYKDFKALKPMDLIVQKGEILGVLGRNGAGKSTLLKIISGVSQPTTGTIEVNGNIIPLLELGGGFNPEYTGKENIYFYCSLLDMRKDEVDLIYDDILEFSELGDFINVPLKKYSSGMRARLAFSVSINIDPEILILDEVLSVGDELFKRKCYAKMDDFFRSGKTILYVTHSMQSIQNLCTRAILLHQGELVCGGEPEYVIEQYRKITRDLKGNDVLVRSTEQQEDRKSFFVKDFVSSAKKNTLFDKLNIADIKIVSGTGEDVNHLTMYQEYFFSFTFQSEANFEKLAFQITFYTAENFIVGKCVFPGRNMFLNDVSKGSEKKIKIGFMTVWRPGLYGIKIAASTLKYDNRVNLGSIRDASLFKVMETSWDLGNTGYYSLFSNGTIHDLEE